MNSSPCFGRFLTLVAFLSIVLLPAATSAQTVGGSIAGVVRDATGAVLPGVTVEASSPALIEKVRTAVTDNGGNYRIPELRPGTYVVTFTLPGFSVVRREGLELAVGFTANVSAEMRIGGLEETITVTGSSPVVDIQNVRTQNTFARETLDILPTNRSVAGYATLTLGATLNDPRNQNVGGDQSEALSSAGFSIHGGRSDDQKLMLDGMNATDASFAGNTNRNAINQVAVQETVFQTGGMGAEAETGGVQINVIPREGGNNVAAYLNVNGTSGRFQADNLSDDLKARGLRNVAPVKKVYDAGGAFGGPITRDKLWFFVASRAWGSQKFAPENYFNATPDGYRGRPDSGVTTYTPDLDRQAYTNGYLKDLYTVRITWKVTEKSKINFQNNLQSHCDCYRGVDGLLAPEAVQQRIYGPSGIAQSTWNYPASNRLLIEAGGTYSFYLSETGRAPGVKETDISVLELSTGYRHGSAVSATTNYARPYKLFAQANQRFVVSYVTGSHSFKTGFTDQQGWNRDRTESNYLVTPYGNAPVAYRFRNGLPVQIDQYTELENTQRLAHNIGLFLQAQWTIKRLTMNLGMRYSYFNAFVPSQTIRAPGNRDSMFLAPQYGPDGEVFPQVNDVPNWKNWQPRVGAAYDLFGNGRTAIKASLGQYVAYEGLTQLPRANVPARAVAATARRNWSDANGDFYPDCDLRIPTANGECGPISNTNLGRPVPSTQFSEDVLINGRTFNWQGAVSVQQQLRGGIGLNIGYFRTWYGNLRVQHNAALSPADFDPYCVTAPNDSQLGDYSGRQICGFYDVKPAAFGRTQNIIALASNFGEQTEVYDGLDIGVQGRFGRGGIIMGGMNIGRTVQDNCAVANSNPQVVTDFAESAVSRQGDEFCRLINSNQSQYKFAGNYPLPFWGIDTALTYQNNPGIPIFASLPVTSAMARGSLGRNFSAGANAVVNTAILRPYTEFTDRIQQIDLRFSKRMTMGGRGTLRPQLDIYNITNSASILGMNETYGPTWLQPTSILGARLVKLGVILEF